MIDHCKNGFIATTTKNLTVHMQLSKGFGSILTQYLNIRTIFYCKCTFVVTFRLVQLDKLRLKTRTKEEEQALARGGKVPFINDVPSFFGKK